LTILWIFSACKKNIIFGDVPEAKVWVIFIVVFILWKDGRIAVIENVERVENVVSVVHSFFLSPCSRPLTPCFSFTTLFCSYHLKGYK
jgi:hypothetical protein